MILKRQEYSLTHRIEHELQVDRVTIVVVLNELSLTVRERNKNENNHQTRHLLYISSDHFEHHSNRA